jgi:hypothetical protein
MTRNHSEKLYPLVINLGSTLLSKPSRIGCQGWSAAQAWRTRNPLVKAPHISESQTFIRNELKLSNSMLSNPQNYASKTPEYYFHAHAMRLLIFCYNLTLQKARRKKKKRE